MTAAPILSSTSWSPQQEAALRDIAAWLRDPSRQVFYLAGFAGTGKTTLAQEVAAQVRGLTLFAAYTGKAASVLRSKGCPNASTLHSLIYRCEEVIDYLTGRKRMVFEKRLDSPLIDASLLIIDEVSMLNEALGRDVESFRRKILVLGDPEQLPPVEGAGYFTARRPDLLLTEIHRQAADNPIIRYATMARRGEPLPYVGEGAFRRLKRPFASADAQGQVLVGTHRSRQAHNAAVRRSAGRIRETPEAGETIVALRNRHELGIYNGTLWTCLGDAREFGDDLLLDLTDGEVTHWNLPVALADPKQVPRDLLPIDYGYALTVHKAQGSEWPDVTLHDDGFGAWSGADPHLRRRWTYTAITRASETVTIHSRGQ